MSHSQGSAPNFHLYRLIIASLFIAATLIGAAYFLVPIFTGIAGFFPSVIMTILIWGFTLATALLYAEATLSQNDGANLFSLTRNLIGKYSALFFSIIFFLTLMSYLAAYTYFNEKFFTWFFSTYLHQELNPFLNSFISTAPYFCVIFFGIRFSFNINALLAIGLGISLLFTFAFGQKFVEPARLFQNQWIYIFYSVPTLFNAFGFMAVIPPVCTYLNRQPKLIIWSAVIGAGFTLIVYIAWQWLLIGSIPAATFWVDFEEGAKIEQIFSLVQTFPKIAFILNFTLFFSMITSMIGNGLAAVEFIADAFKVPLQQRKPGWTRLYICLSLFIIILLFSWIKEQPLLYLLQKFTAPLGQVLVEGIVPLWLVIQARYVFSLQSTRMLGGGKIALMVIGVAIFILIYLEGIMFIR
jgi:tyrosine-specific transport protein